MQLIRDDEALTCNNHVDALLTWLKTFMCAYVSYKRPNNTRQSSKRFEESKAFDEVLKRDDALSEGGLFQSEAECGGFEVP